MERLRTWTNVSDTLLCPSKETLVVRTETNVQEWFLGRMVENPITIKFRSKRVTHSLFSGRTTYKDEHHQLEWSRTEDVPEDDYSAKPGEFIVLFAIYSLSASYVTQK